MANLSESYLISFFNQINSLTDIDFVVLVARSELMRWDGLRRHHVHIEFLFIYIFCLLVYFFLLGKIFSA